MQLKRISSFTRSVCGQRCSAVGPAGSSQLGTGIGVVLPKGLSYRLQDDVCIVVFVVYTLTGPSPCVTGAQNTNPPLEREKSAYLIH